MKKRGKVYLVGAGPGDPGLLTVRGAALIARADVIVMDALVNPIVVAGAAARIVDAGKRGPVSDREPSRGPSQAQINRWLVRLAKQGKTVVRLKGGDPFVFGRGSEELEALRAAKIPFEVVPGVSSATAVPAYAGIPITDRRWASQVTFITGHEQPDKEAEGTNWSRLSPSGTLVVMMGVRSWGTLVSRLLENGFKTATPVAAIHWGTTGRQRVLRAALGASPAVFRQAGLSSPAIIVVGQVAALSSTLSWVKKERPLLGRRIGLTRSAEANERLSSLLAAEGAEPAPLPLIEVKPIKAPELARAREALAAGARYDWLVFLSASAVTSLSAVWPGALRALGAARVAAVGPKTAAAAAAAGWRVTFVPEKFDGASLGRSMGALNGRRILLPRARVAPADILRALERRGARVDVLPVYETVRLKPSAAERARFEKNLDAVTFLSTSAVEAFAAAFPAVHRRRVFLRAVPVAIGSTTAAAVRARLRARPLVASSATAEGVVAVLRRHFSAK